jgi:serine/threonine-protein kinase
MSGATGIEPVPLDSRAPKEMELTQVGRYRLCFELASGGMATVYLARLDGPHGFEKLVALKRVHPHLVSERRYVEMFLDEARIASAITHANVCSVFDFGESGGEYYLAMEYLVGEPLARLVRRAAASAEQRESPLLTLKMTRIIEEACEGLHAAHESRDASGQPLNVVHRDVSPRNLFMTYSGVVQIVDFGIASARQRVHRTATGHLKGTMPYMAPEQVTGGGSDRRLDIWSLGVVLWELLTLERLFRRETEVETMYAVLVGDIPLPSDRRVGIPPELDAIVMKALQRDPEKRWQTAREMGQALHAFASKHSAVVGAAELSNWMEELFPQGEAQKREIMELALTEGFQALQSPQEPDAELTGALTVTAAVQPQTGSTSKPVWKRLSLAIVLGVLLVSVAAVWGFQDLEPKVPPSAESAPSTVEPAVAPSEPEPAAPLAPTRTGTQESAVKAPSDEPASTRVEPEVIPPAAEQAKPEQPKTSKQRNVARKARPRKKPSKPAQPEPAASGLPGQVKIVTKGHSVEIYEGTKLLGKAPAVLTLPAGKHRLRLKSTESGESLLLPVTVVANATKTISLDVD